MKKTYPIVFLVILLTFGIQQIGIAQCVMCKAVAETATSEGESVAKGINYGIIYIMGIPYLLLTVLFFTFRESKGLSKK